MADIGSIINKTDPMIARLIELDKAIDEERKDRLVRLIKIYNDYAKLTHKELIILPKDSAVFEWSDMDRNHCLRLILTCVDAKLITGEEDWLRTL